MADPSYVLIVGAGGSVADAGKVGEVRRPPLDRGFLRAASKDPTNAGDLDKIQVYLREKYAIADLRDPDIDSLEDTMVRLYGDVFDPTLGAAAYTAFMRLMHLFNKRLAETTNAIPMTQKKLLYRVVRRLARHSGHCTRLTIITFNQDIQIEKALFALSSRLPAKLGSPFAFPELYELDDVRASRLENIPSFPTNDGSQGYVRLLKLHGSLNWYSVHRSSPPERSAVFRPERIITITPRRQIAPDMRRITKGRNFYTFPIVVPPVNHKAAILHDKLRPLWRDAEDALASATEVTVFGYSCPAADFESANMISRAFNRNDVCERLTIIDPDPSVLLRFANLTKMDSIQYFKSALAFLRPT